MKKIMVAAILLLNAFALQAAPDKIEIQLKGRVGLASENTDFGVKCDYLRLMFKANLTDELSFVFRQRLNKAVSSSNFMSATDYFLLCWKHNGWELSGGKHWIACGGFEYQSSSYDLYIRPMFFAGLGGMYNYVVNGARHFSNGDRLCLQVSNSLYSTDMSNLLGYSLLWSGRWGVWERYWSVNFFERSKDDYNQYFCLGNRFHMGKVVWDAGITHRIDVASPVWFGDFSCVAKMKYTPCEWMDVFAKVTWDYKQEGIKDPMLADGTDVVQAGGGVEFYPFKAAPELRLHCMYYNRGGDVNCVMTGVAYTLNILKR